MSTGAQQTRARWPFQARYETGSKRQGQGFALNPPEPAALDTVKAGILQEGTAASFNGRYGMPSFCSLGTWSDRRAPIADVIDPPAGPSSWYVNAATGNDNNDGTSPTTAWASVAKVNAESNYCGMFPTSLGYVAGDALIIDTTAANLVLGGNSLTLATRGLNVTQLGGGRTGTGEIQAWEKIAASSWSATTGTAHVFQTGDTDSSAVLWENDTWFNHITGANLAAVQSALDSTAGSFWTDGITMYVHPLGDTDPRQDGSTYTRSYYRGTNSAVILTVPDCHVNGLRIRKTCVADPSSNDPGVNYCLQGRAVSAARR